jgi:hypothetical protein
MEPGQQTKKAPRPNETRGKQLVGCGQPKELGWEGGYQLLATVSGCQPPPRAL